jgi:hypothetical protein
MANRKSRSKKSSPKTAWNRALEALAVAEAEVARQVTVLVRKNRLGAGDVQAVVKGVGARLAKERASAQKRLGSAAKGLQTRIVEERKALGHAIEEGVQRTLASLNIPSRKEVAALTRKVDELARAVRSRRGRR